MTARLARIAMAAAILLGAGLARAEIVRVYSFENLPGPDGFFGLGAAVTQDMIGATHSTHSMKVAIGAGGFVGARTETVVPAELGDPPGVSYLLFDVTLLQAYADTLAEIGVTVFGHALNKPGGAEFGHQVQFNDTLSLVGLAPGTYTNLRIDLDSAFGPYRPNESFDDIFGPGPNDLTVASAFQFFFSKNVATPLTVYIDNVRLVDLAAFDVDGNGVSDPLTDGLLALRYMFGFTGAVLVTGAVDLDGCTRCTAQAIEDYLADNV